MRRFWFVLILIVLAGGFSAAQDVKKSGPQDRSFVPGDLNLPFSKAVIVGKTIYLAGEIGFEPGTTKVPDSAEREAELVLQAIQATLKKAGSSLDDLVYVQVFCSDVAHFDTWNKVYRKYLKEPFPARAFLGSGKLLFGARFEVMGIAVKH